MRNVLFFIAISLFKLSNCNESESTEINQIEISPFYDTIIFSDVVDIINELNKNFNPPFNTLDNSESESDENIEDLLSEYQHYIDKAHEQRRIYFEKFNKTKNKVPPLRHENYAKTGVPIDNNYKSYYYSHSYYNPNIIKMPPTTYNGPLDLFIPFNPGFRYFNKPEDTPQRKEFKESKHPFNKIEVEGMKPLNLPPLLSKPMNKPVKTSCYCIPGQMPCTCNCKQCVLPQNSIVSSENQLKSVNNGADKKILSRNPSIFGPKVSEHMMDDLNNNANTLNLRIKVDIQLPKIQDSMTGKYDKMYNSAEEVDDITKEFASSIKLPTTYFNFPIPMDVFGFKNTKVNKHDPTPIHKIMIHKKKKSRFGGNNKKHRKKLITFHNIKVSSSSPKPLLEENNNTNYILPKNNDENTTRHLNETISNTTTVKSEITNLTIITTEPAVHVNTTPIEDSIYFTLNITNNENETDEGHKIGNSIELEYKTVSNTTTSNLRQKREIKTENKTYTYNENTTNSSVPSSKQNNIIVKSNQNMLKKSNKNIFSDTELLHWPTNNHSFNVSKIENITKIILEGENKKAKLNMSKESIRENRTKALEQAVFGQVNWNDIDTVVPPFISFIGKYINGVLTFCSEKLCHSMKCANKTCVHRKCSPQQRFQYMGHCNGCNKTDSIASMESIMDLPSNVAVEIVDILQDKMLPNLFGKATICISSKCITFMATKKMFIKSKCVAKDLNKTGHCSNIKKP